MPHYVTQLDDEGQDTFAVYSTIVDNLITETMSAEEMKGWLVEREYTSWTTKDPAYVNPQGHMHWHEKHGFMFTRLFDNWFTLPRRDWRDD